MKRIAIKIGSNVLTRANGTLNITRISSLVDQVAELHNQGIQVILISSGAVASGRSVHKINRKLDSVDQRQLFSAIGQAKLISLYDELFSHHGITIGQVLTTKESFSTRRHYLNQRNCMQVMLENNVIPIVNENDTISITELMFTDNDELSGIIASMLDAEMLIILSNVDGIFNGPPSDPNSSVIREIRADEDISDFIVQTKSTFGRGGMLTKTSIARKVADEGIDVVIANGIRENILNSILSHDETVPCTRFIKTEDGVSSVKKWIAHSGGFAKGAIHINKNAREALFQKAATSLLPIGITKTEGNFDKDDIVKIIDENGQYIGVGRTQYDQETLSNFMGQKGHKPIIHYNYLFLE